MLRKLMIAALACAAMSVTSTASALGDRLNLDSLESSSYLGVYFVVSQLLLVLQSANLGALADPASVYARWDEMLANSFLTSGIALQADDINNDVSNFCRRQGNTWHSGVRNDNPPRKVFGG